MLAPCMRDEYPIYHESQSIAHGVTAYVRDCASRGGDSADTRSPQVGVVPFRGGAVHTLVFVSCGVWNPLALVAPDS